MKRIISLLIVCVTACVMTGCGNKQASGRETVPEAKEEAHENANTTTLTDEQMASIGVVLGSIEEKQLAASLKTNGVLKVPNQNKASVNSIYSGVIRSLHIQPGNNVRKGQVIATVANPEFIQVQSDYIGIQAKISLAELEVNRQQELNRGNAGALKNLQAAETQLSTLRNTRATLRQQVQLMGINPSRLSNGKLVSVLSITSPISGVVSNVMVKMGSYVDVTTPVADIVDNSQLHLDLFVYEKDLPQLKDNSLIHFTLTNNPGKEYDAQIYSLGSSFEGESKAVTVHAKVQGERTGLIDGMNVTAIISMEKATVPAVPTEAIVTIAGQDYIFVATEEHAEDEHKTTGRDSGTAAVDHKEDENNTAPAHGGKKGMRFEKIPVAKGATEVGYTQITLLKEIPAGSKIVVKGAFFVLAKMNNAGEGEHGH